MKPSCLEGDNHTIENADAGFNILIGFSIIDILLVLPKGFDPYVDNQILRRY